jgi:hypothetical protein
MLALMKNENQLKLRMARWRDPSGALLITVALIIALLIFAVALL